MSGEVSLREGRRRACWEAYRAHGEALPRDRPSSEKDLVFSVESKPRNVEDMNR